MSTVEYKSWKYDELHYNVKQFTSSVQHFDVTCLQQPKAISGQTCRQTCSWGFALVRTRNHFKLPFLCLNTEETRFTMHNNAQFSQQSLEETLKSQGLSCRSSKIPVMEPAKSSQMSRSSKNHVTMKTGVLIVKIQLWSHFKI